MIRNDRITMAKMNRLRTSVFDPGKVLNLDISNFFSDSFNRYFGVVDCRIYEFPMNCEALLLRDASANFMSEGLLAHGSMGNENESLV